MALPLVFFLSLLGGCATKPYFIMRDAQAAQAVKRIAVLPFLNANLLSVEFEHKKGWFERNDKWTQNFVRQAKKKLSRRFEFIEGEPVNQELIKLGALPQPGQESAPRRAGYDVDQAIKTGRALQADAVLLGAGSKADTKAFKKAFQEAVSIRLLDVRTGKVIWAISCYKKNGRDKAVIAKVIKQLQKTL